MTNCFVTGANEGIGYYLVDQLLKDGNRVAVFDQETSNLVGLQNTYGNRLLCMKGNVKDEEQMFEAIQEMIAVFGGIEVAIHNACSCTFEPESSALPQEYKDIMDVNFFGAIHMIKSVLPYMTEQKKGRVVFTSSGVGVTGFPGISPYASSKGALESLAKCLNLEYARNNISFHIFHPPLTRTRSSSPLPVPQEFMASPETVGRGLAKHLHSNRFVICHSMWQKIQTQGCYLFPLKMGKLFAKLTEGYKG